MKRRSDNRVSIYNMISVFKSSTWKSLLTLKSTKDQVRKWYVCFLDFKSSTPISPRVNNKRCKRELSWHVIRNHCYRHPTSRVQRSTGWFIPSLHSVKIGHYMFIFIVLLFRQFFVSGSSVHRKPKKVNKEKRRILSLIL